MFEDLQEDFAHKRAVDGEGLGNPRSATVNKAVDDGHLGHLFLQCNLVVFFRVELRPVDEALLVELCDNRR